MIDTAGTLQAAAQTVLDEGAARVYAAATHPILSGSAYENLAAARVRGDRRHRHDPDAPGRPGQPPGPELRGAADRLDPPDLHRRLGVRGLRRREPALLRPRPPRRSCRTASASATRSSWPCSTRPARRRRRRPRPQARAAGPARADRGAAERVGRRRAAPLAARRGPAGRPLDHLLARDFGAFEDDLDALAVRGFVLRGGGSVG